MKVYVLLEVPAAHHSRPPKLAGVTTNLAEAQKWEATSSSNVYKEFELKSTAEEHLEEAQRLLLHNPKPPSAAE